MLNAGKKVAILVGAGALNATDEVIAVADKLGAGVAKALLGKAALPDDLAVGDGLDRPARHQAELRPDDRVRHAADDRLRLSRTAEFLPKEGDARGVQIDIKADMLSLRYPMEVNLVGDSAETLRALLPLLAEKNGPRMAREDRRLDRRLVEDARQARTRTGKDASIRSARVWELSPRIPANAIVTSDSGSCANWYARDLKVQRGMMCSLSGGLASMGAAVPYAIAAKFAYPERPVIALVGDGAMQMNNMAELITVSKYWKQLGRIRAGSAWC